MFDVVISIGLTVALFGLAAWLLRASLPRPATTPAMLLGGAVLLVGGGIALAWQLRTRPQEAHGDDGSESVVDRVPEPAERASLVASSIHRLGLFETEIGYFSEEWLGRVRLAGLHHRHVQDFVEREGFGVGRVQVPVADLYRHDVPVRLQLPDWPSTEKVRAVE
jgi:hypothetical protein